MEEEGVMVLNQTVMWSCSKIIGKMTFSPLSFLWAISVQLWSDTFTVSAASARTERTFSNKEPYCSKSSVIAHTSARTHCLIEMGLQTGSQTHSSVCSSVFACVHGDINRSKNNTKHFSFSLSASLSFPFQHRWSEWDGKKQKNSRWVHINRSVCYHWHKPHHK